ncbi:hypothetical protein Syun_025508 [Stephania yunnanensis]|uniref:Pentatricopeptide repeat-containing protein n=1 Tax=Stephania yunnanensis TaxID=152371 RepID=A0AAP0EXC4_9MAGN
MRFLTLIAIRSRNYSSRSSISAISHIKFTEFHGTCRYSSGVFKHKSVPGSRASETAINKPSETFDSIDFNQKTVEETISSYGNDWKRAFEFFDWVESDCRFSHNTSTYNRMIDVLGKFFEFDLAWGLINRMRRSGVVCSPDHTTFRIMFKRYLAAHMVQEAIDVYNTQMENFDLKDETSFFNLIDALCDHRHVIEAEELCKGKGSFFANSTKLHNMLLHGWMKMGWWSKCREFWNEMDENNVCRDVHSYSIYMDIMRKCDKPWKAVKLYKEMKKKGIQLDVVAYNTVIHAIGLYEGVDESVRLYREMMEFGCKPNVGTYNTLVKLFCDGGRVRHAYSLLNQMREKGCPPDVITYHSFFRCLNKPKEILILFDRMVESGVRPRMDTYVMLIKKFGQWGFLRPVFIIWKKMEEHGCSPSEFAYNALIDALVQKGMVDMARKYEEEMLARGHSAKPRKELCTKPESNESDDVCG